MRKFPEARPETLLATKKVFKICDTDQRGALPSNNYAGVVYCNLLAWKSPPKVVMNDLAKTG